MKNKIGWCNATWNPVWGCLNNCTYCYARKIAKFRYKRMIEIEFNHYWKKHPSWAWTGDYLSGLKDFKLTFLEAQIDKKFPKKPQKIFVGSMSEIYYWNEEWIEKVIEKIKQYPQHIFIFLSKYMEVYAKWIWPKNCILGVTITKDDDFKKQRGSYYFFNGRNKTLLCFEPILEYIDPGLFSNANIDWMILGAETGKRKDKIIPKKEWVKDIVNYCRYKDIPVYLKDSLKEIYPVEIKEFPDYK